MEINIPIIPHLYIQVFLRHNGSHQPIRRKKLMLYPPEKNFTRDILSQKGIAKPLVDMKCPNGVVTGEIWFIQHSSILFKQPHLLCHNMNTKNFSLSQCLFYRYPGNTNQNTGRFLKIIEVKKLIIPFYLLP
jgi:hypothetical protein